MPAFSEWTIKEVNAAIGAAIAATVGQDGFERNKAFVEDHDHWQDGDGWVGPDGGVKDSEARKLVLAAVQKQFTPNDVISECLDRCANALMQREPDVTFMPLEPAEDEQSEAAKRQKAEAESIRRDVSAWWDGKKLWEHARAALRRARWAQRGALRLWIAPGNLEGSKESGRSLPSSLEFAEALSRVEVMSPLPDAVLVHTDPETQKRAGIVHFTDEEGKAAAELWYVEGEATVVRILGEEKEGDETYEIPMGGRLPIQEMAAELLITEPVRKQQDRLNFFESLLVRVAETGGFPERYTINAQPNGIWLRTQPGDGTSVLEQRQVNGVTWYLHAIPRTLGAAITTDLRGLVVGKEADGTAKLATPSVTFKDPTDPEYAVKAAKHARATILGNCKQGHVALEGTAEASGTAYQQARADFEADLTGVKTPLEGLLRDTIEAAIAMAEAMSTQKVLGRFRCVVNLNVTSGPITPEEHAQINADVKDGTMSRETGMGRKGVEDVQAELERMRSDPDAAIAHRRKQVETIQLLVGEGWTNERAAQFLGITDTELLRLCREQDAENEKRRLQQEAQQDDIDEALRAEEDEGEEGEGEPVGAAA